MNTTHPDVTEWTQRLAILTATGLRPDAARAQLALTDPELHVRYLAACNPGCEQAARAFAERERRAAERRGEQTQPGPTKPPASAGRRTFAAGTTSHRSAIT